MANSIFTRIGIWSLPVFIAATLASCAATKNGGESQTEPATRSVSEPRVGCGERLHHILPEGSVLGEGKTVILILAGIGGAEPAALALAGKLREHLKNRPVPGREIILLIHQDGDVRRSFTPETDQPLSKAIIQVIHQCRPTRIISLRQLYLEGFDPDGPKEAFRIARRMSDYTYPDAPITDLETSPGSLGRFGEIKEIPVISVAISSDHAEIDGERLWQRFGLPLLAGIRYPEAPDDMPIHARIERGIGYINAGDVDNAVRTFQALSIRDPGRSEISEYLFQSHLMAARQAHASGNFTAARHHSAKALEIRPDCRICKDMHQEIRRTPKPAKTNFAGENSAKPGSGSKSEVDTESTSAIPEHAELVRTEPDPNPADPERAKNLLTEARVRFEAGEYAGARDLLKSALDADPDCEACRKLLNQARESAAALQAGLTHLEASAFNPAIVQFTWIRNNNPGDASLIPHLVAAHSGLGNQLFAGGAYEKAGEQFEQALAYDPACGNCMTRFDNSLQADMSFKNGIILLERGDSEAAAEAFSNVIRLNPEDSAAREYLASAHRGWGDSLCRDEKWIEGISHLQSAIEFNPECTECQAALTSCIQAFNVRQYQKAKEFVVTQQLGEALDELTRIPAEHRDSKVRELIDRLKPFETD